MRRAGAKERPIVPHARPTNPTGEAEAHRSPQAHCSDRRHRCIPKYSSLNLNKLKRDVSVTAVFVRRSNEDAEFYNKPTQKHSTPYSCGTTLVTSIVNCHTRFAISLPLPFANLLANDLFVLYLNYSLAHLLLSFSHTQKDR